MARKIYKPQRFRNRVGDYAESGGESWRWPGLGRKRRVVMVVFWPQRGRDRAMRDTTTRVAERGEFDSDRLSNAKGGRMRQITQTGWLG